MASRSARAATRGISLRLARQPTVVANDVVDADARAGRQARLDVIARRLDAKPSTSKPRATFETVAGRSW
jgi:hypothetical protein